MEGTGWTNAEDLQVGDDVRNAEGETGEVESIVTEETSQEMYNLTVDEAHTFFVGEGHWLVHNAGLCDGLIGATGGPYKTTVNKLAASDSRGGIKYRTSNQRANYEVFVKDGILVNRNGEAILFGWRRNSIAVMNSEGNIYFLDKALMT